MDIKRITGLLLTLFFLVSVFTSCFSDSGITSAKSSQNPPVLEEVNVKDYENTQELQSDALFLIDLGIIDREKYEFYSYLPRVSAVQIILDITGLTEEALKSSYTHPFIDLSETAEKEISYAYYNGIFDGLTVNTFMEDEACSIETFISSLIKAMDFIGETNSAVTEENALELAVKRGILTEDDVLDEGSLFSVNDAMSVCKNALYTYIDGKQTLLTYLSYIGDVAFEENVDSAYEIFGRQISYLYEEDFENKEFSGTRIVDNGGKTYWTTDKVKGSDNMITDDGQLQVAGDGQYLVDNQQIALEKRYLDGNESYGMTFTVNIQSMGNEGDESRAIFRMIPRTADEEFTKYYSINYFMVIPLGPYQSNLGRCKWSITNTNAPTGTAPLAEAFFLLKEGVDYTARVMIENTESGDVHIEFYIDGADHYTDQTKPLLEYTDTSEYKIMDSVAGPAFGNSGSLHFGWGVSSRVLFDDVKIYDVDSFKNETEQFSANTLTEVNLSERNELFCQMNYLIKRGVIKPYQRNLDFGGNVSVAQFLASSMYLNGIFMTNEQTLDEFVLQEYKRLFKNTKAEKDTDLSRNITRYEAAVIIKGMMKGRIETYRYRYIFNDVIDSDYSYPAYFAVQNSYLLLDEENNFKGNEHITRQELLMILSQAVDSSLRDKNYRLEIPAIFSDYGILQRNKTVPITGRGMSGDTVTVAFAGQKKTAEVIDGKWIVELDSMPAGGPYDLTISDSGYSYTFNKLYVGEVIVVAGQSNSEWNVYDSDDNADTLQKFNNQTRVRYFSPDSMRSTTPAFDSNTKWQMASDEWSEYIFGGASAIGVFTIQNLIEDNKDLEGVRIGLIQMTYGGTSIELFMPTCVCDKYDLVQEDDEFIFSGFWNGYMAGITPYAASFLMYYQGENSAHLGYQYELFLRDYIWGVRKEFYDENLPILLVQISGYGDSYGQDIDSWPKIREIQQRVANTIDNIGFATTIDLADPDRYNIHPTRKRPIGDRLAWLAMDMIYNKDIDKASRQMSDYLLEDGVYTVWFEKVISLHYAEDAFGDIDFEVLGTDGKWVAAESEIYENTIKIWNDYIPNPIGVRYAWANFPKAILFDENDLPILPFNSTVDYNKIILAQEYTTDETHLKKAYHLLNTNDAVINATRGNEFRYVKEVNAYMLEYIGEPIDGQVPGDLIILLEKSDGFMCESGTTDTKVIKENHMLNVGDWVLNTKYGEIRMVTEVIDENTFIIDSVIGQAAGNVFEVFINAGEVTAQK